MLTFRIENDEDLFHVYCPELPGCHTFGKTPYEAMINLNDPVQLYNES